eukprot:1030386-Rhodomonas_salina.1
MFGAQEHILRRLELLRCMLPTLRKRCSTESAYTVRTRTGYTSRIVLLRTGVLPPSLGPTRIVHSICTPSQFHLYAGTRVPGYKLFARCVRGPARGTKQRKWLAPTPVLANLIRINYWVVVLLLLVDRDGQFSQYFAMLHSICVQTADR